MGQSRSGEMRPGPYPQHSLAHAGLGMASRLLAVSALNSGSLGKDRINVFCAFRGSWGKGEIPLLLSIPPSSVRTTVRRVGDGEEGALY